MYSRHFLEIENNLSIIFLSPDGEDLDEIFSKHERFSENILQLFLTLRKHEKKTNCRRLLAKYFLSHFSLDFSNAALLLQQSELLFLAVNNTQIADNYKNLF